MKISTIYESYQSLQLEASRPHWKQECSSAIPGLPHNAETTANSSIYHSAWNNAVILVMPAGQIVQLLFPTQCMKSWLGSFDWILAQCFESKGWNWRSIGNMSHFNRAVTMQCDTYNQAVWNLQLWHIANHSNPVTRANKKVKHLCEYLLSYFRFYS